jgi:hypothetical protein
MNKHAGVFRDGMPRIGIDIIKPNGSPFSISVDWDGKSGGGCAHPPQKWTPRPIEEYDPMAIDVVFPPGLPIKITVNGIVVVASPLKEAA